MHAKSFQSGPTLYDPMDYSPPGFSVHGILQARILKWIAVPSSRGSSWHRIKPRPLMSPASAGGFFTTSATWEDFTDCNNLYQSLSFLLNQKTVSIRGVLVLSPQYAECRIARVSVGFPNGSVVNKLLAQCRRRGFQSLGQNPLEKEMATHSRILAWKSQNNNNKDSCESKRNTGPGHYNIHSV